jgi:hypothetical protein
MGSFTYLVTLFFGILDPPLSFRDTITVQLPICLILFVTRAQTPLLPLERYVNDPLINDFN